MIQDEGNQDEKKGHTSCHHLLNKRENSGRKLKRKHIYKTKVKKRMNHSQESSMKL